MRKKITLISVSYTHLAAGVVISQKSVDEYVPLSLGSDGSVTTQFTMTTLEELGLLKMDFPSNESLFYFLECLRMKNNKLPEKRINK